MDEHDATKVVAWIHKVKASIKSLSSLLYTSFLAQYPQECPSFPVRLPPSETYTSKYKVVPIRRKGVSFYYAKTNVLRFVAGVRHFVACVLFIKCFSGTDAGFSTEGIGYCSGTGVSDALGAEGDGVVPGKLVAWIGWLARSESMDNGWGTTGNQ